MTYSNRVATLIEALENKAQLGIDLDVTLNGRVPSNATSEFLINKEQGDWAERLIEGVINEQSEEFFAVQYGRQDTLSAGDDGFADFYREYQQELNELGKKPDLLLYRRQDFIGVKPDLSNEEDVRKAVAAFEVRSSAFLEKKYREYMAERNQRAVARCEQLRGELLAEPFATVLRKKSKIIYEFIAGSTTETFKELRFRKPSWSSSEELRAVSGLLGELLAAIKVLQTRDFLSITPKVEDIALVSRWINRFGVPHFYVQVFFDGAFAIPFERIVSIPLNSEAEDSEFRIEKDSKNQGKSTIKINVDLASSLVEDIEIPAHESRVKELARGRLIFFVAFDGVSGVLDNDRFLELLNGN